MASGILAIERFDAQVLQEPMHLSGGIDLVTRIMDVTVTGPPNPGEPPRDLVTVRGRPESPTFGLRKSVQ